jgi:hypothetical protein
VSRPCDKRDAADVLAAGGSLDGLLTVGVAERVVFLALLQGVAVFTQTLGQTMLAWASDNIRFVIKLGVR